MNSKATSNAPNAMSRYLFPLSVTPDLNIKYLYEWSVKRYMERETESENTPGASISLSLPPSDPDLFKYKATSDVLLFLTNHRFSDFSLRELATQIGHSHQSVGRAVNVLSSNELVIESSDSNRRLVQINRQRLSIPDDPILRIPQSEYHQPVKVAVTELRENISDVVGIILYGSVARGDADRRSDIDLWVLTRSGRAESQREANAIARDLEETAFDGDRYAYDIDVEAVQAIPTYTDDIRAIIVSGIPMYKTSDFETVENLLLEEAADE
jgi:predicted nucleotidyltransferase/peroxiredoxin